MNILVNACFVIILALTTSQTAAQTTLAPPSNISTEAATLAPTINPITNDSSLASTVNPTTDASTLPPLINPITNDSSSAALTVSLTTNAQSINPIVNVSTAAPTTSAMGNSSTLSTIATTQAATVIPMSNSTVVASTLKPPPTGSPLARNGTWSEIGKHYTQAEKVYCFRPGVGVETVFKVTNKVFSVQLLNKSSAVFKSLQQTIESELMVLFSSQINNIQVVQIRVGSVQVKTEFFVLKNDNNSVSNVNNLLKDKINSGSLGPLTMDKNVYSFNIKGESCGPPNVTITNMAASPSHPTQIKRSKAHIVQTAVKLNCNSLVNTSFKWSVWSLRLSGNDYLLSSPGKPDFTVKGTAEWNLKKHTFNYGLYLVQFRVSIENPEEIFNSDLKFFSIIQTPIIAGISGGSHVKRGFNKVVQLDASPSYDPDVNPNNHSGMTFTWLCKKKAESFPSVPIADIPTVSSTGSKGKGGCFDTGIGKLSSTNRVVFINTGDMVVNKSYTVKLVVTKATGRNASFEQMLDVVTGDPPQISIRCHINCLPRVSPSSRIKVKTICNSPKQICGLRFRYQWSLLNRSESVKDSWNPVNNLQDFLSTPLTSPDAVIKNGVLESDRTYQLTVKVEANEVVPGISSYIFETNSPPKGGTCEITPPSGEGLKTQFTFTCQGWNDEDQPLMYQFYYVTEPGLTSVIAYGQDEQAKSKLPVGKKDNNYEVTIHMRITDSLAAYAEKIIKIKVEPITSGSGISIKESIDEASKDVDLFFKKGDLKKATQLANAVLETMSNTKESEINEKERMKRIDAIVKQMTSNKADNLQTLTQFTSVIGRATANPNEISLTTQKKTIKSLGEMTNLLVEKSNEQSAPEDSLMEASGENLALSLGNVMKSASRKANIYKVKDEVPQRKESIEVAEKSVSLVNKVGESLLRRKGVDESPSVVKTASLSMVLAKQSPADLNNTKLEEGGTSFELPSGNIIGSSLGNFKFIDSQMTFTKFNPFTWDISANLVKSDVSSLVLRNDQDIIPVQELTQDIKITIPQLSSSNTTANLENSFLKPKEIRNYKFVIDHPGTAIELQIVTFNQATVKILVKHKEKPSESSHDFMEVLSNLPNCSPDELSKACRKADNSVFLSSKILQTEGVYYVGILLAKSHSRKKRSCFGHGRQKRSCVEPKDAPKPENMTIIPKYDPATDVNYTVSVQRYNCMFWDGNKWTSKGCKAGSHSNNTSLQCFCNHLTSFGGSLLIEPNPIDFDVVLLELLRLDETGNVAVLSTILVFLLLYLVIAIIARRADRRDTTKFGPPLTINSSDSNGYRYEMTVITGIWRNCGTTANVAIEIHGSEATSHRIILSRDMEPSRVLLGNGNADKLMITLPVSLGYIEYLNVMHDNSGSSPSWFLDRIILKDLQLDTTLLFLHRDWFALEKGNGKIKKILLPTSPLEMKSFQYNFNYRTTKKFTEDHLWLSVLTKPPHSNFTRLQRATCCLCVLFSVMILNAMFYKLDKTPDPRIQIGPLKFSLRQITVGVYSSLIVVPIGILIVFLFQNSRPKSFKKDHNNKGIKGKILDCICCHGMTIKAKHGKISASKEHLALNDQLSNSHRQSSSIDDNGLKTNSAEKDATTTVHSVYVEQISVRENAQLISIENVSTSDENSLENSEKSKTLVGHDTNERVLGIPALPKDKREITNIEDKGEEDCRSFVVEETEKMNSNKNENLKSSRPPTKKSFKELLTDIFFSEEEGESQFSLPHCFIYISWLLCIVTVLVSASFTFMYSLQWGKEIANQWLSSMLVSFTEDLFVVQPVKICITAIFFALFFKNNKTVKEISEAPTNVPKQSKGHSKIKTDNVNMKFPEENELENAKDYQMKEEKMFSFVRETTIYGVFLILLTIVCYGNRSYHGYEMTKTVKNEFHNFSKLTTSEKYWKWINTQYAQSTYAGTWYNGAAEQNEVYIGNKKSILIGMPRIRQLRIKSDTCIIPKKARSIATICYDRYSFDEEDKTPLYLPGWMPFQNTYNLKWDNLSQLCPKPWRYSSADELQYFPSWGYFHTYSGGGYVADLGYRNKTTVFVTRPLRSNKWIDHRTRALLLEFSIFNPSTNQLSAITLYYEALPTTFGRPFQVVETFALYGTESASYDIFLICKLLFIFLAVFYLAREARRAYKMKNIYFKSFWNWFEIMQVAVALSVVVCYVMKEKNILGAVQHVKENPYVTVNFQYALAWKNGEDATLSLSVFIATVKILRMLRFNPHIIIFSSSLKTSRQTLISYSVILFVVMVSFALLGKLTLGNSMYQYHTILQALYSQLLMSLGAKMHLNDIINTLPILGPLSGFTYKVMMSFIFVNFYISVINDSYEEVKSNTDTNSKEFEMSDFMLNRLKEIFLRKTYKVHNQKDDNSNSTDVKDKTIFSAGERKSEGKNYDAEKGVKAVSFANNWTERETPEKHVLHSEVNDVEEGKTGFEVQHVRAVSSNEMEELQLKDRKENANRERETQNQNNMKRAFRIVTKQTQSLKKISNLVTKKKKRQPPASTKQEIKEAFNKQTHQDLEEKSLEIYKRTTALKKDDRNEDVEFVYFLCLFLKNLMQTRPETLHTNTSEFGEENEGYNTDCNSEDKVESSEAYQSDSEITQEEMWGSSSEDLINNLMSSRRPRIPEHLRFKNTLGQFQFEGQNYARNKVHWRP